jgi:hypothetical protein
VGAQDGSSDDSDMPGAQGGGDWFSKKRPTEEGIELAGTSSVPTAVVGIPPGFKTSMFNLAKMRDVLQKTFAQKVGVTLKAANYQREDVKDSAKFFKHLKDSANPSLNPDTLTTSILIPPFEIIDEDHFLFSNLGDEGVDTDPSQPADGTELSAEPSAGPVAELSAEPSAGPVAELSAEPSAGPVAELSAEPSAGPAASNGASPMGGSRKKKKRKKTRKQSKQSSNQTRHLAEAISAEASLIHAGSRKRLKSNSLSF